MANHARFRFTVSHGLVEVVAGSAFVAPDLGSERILLEFRAPLVCPLGIEVKSPNL